MTGGYLISRFPASAGIFLLQIATLVGLELHQLLIHRNN